MEIHGLDKADFAALMQEPVSSPERTSKRQVIKAFASKLKRSTSKIGSPVRCILLQLYFTVH
jgi:hypothetical protein